LCIYRIDKLRDLQPLTYHRLILRYAMRSILCLFYLSWCPRPVNEDHGICGSQCYSDAARAVNAYEHAGFPCLEVINHGLSFLVRGIPAHHGNVELLGDLRCCVLVGTEDDDGG